MSHDTKVICYKKYPGRYSTRMYTQHHVECNVKLLVTTNLWVIIITWPVTTWLSCNARSLFHHYKFLSYKSTLSMQT